MTQPISLEHELYLIDLQDMGMRNRTGSYIIKGAQPALIETGPSPSIPHLLAGLRELELSPEDVRYIIVTHIHLDHAGGAGWLLQSCPNAKVVVHPKGARHLAHPERLIQGAQAVYGEQFEAFFHPILPVPEERLLIMQDGETLPLGEGRDLQFFDSPGHANHHFSILDSVSRHVFTGDTVGIQYGQTEDCGFRYYLPSTSPNQFDPEAMRRSIAMIRSLKPRAICFSHYGWTEDLTCLDGVERWLDRFVQTAKRCQEQGVAWQTLAEHLLEQVRTDLSGRGVPDGHPVYDVLAVDLPVCAMGLYDYLQRQSRTASSAG